MSIRLFNNSGGYIDLNAGGDGTASNTFTLPAETGTVLTTGSTFAGTGPAFSVYLGSQQDITTSVATKVALDTVNFDTASCWDNVNYRFTPNVAGYYQLNGQIYLRSTAAGTHAQTYISKNSGTENVAYSLLRYTSGSSTAYGILNCTGLTYMNGSTDYVELFGYIVATSPFYTEGLAYTKMSGCLVRAA